MKMKKILAGVLAFGMMSAAMMGCSNTESADTGDYSTTVVATLGDENIYLDEANFLARSTQYTYEVYYLSYMGGDLWSYDVTGDGTTLEDQVKQDVMTSLYQTHVLDNAAEQYGVELTDDEEDLIEDAVTDYFDAAPDLLNEVAYATRDLVTKVYTDNALANKVYAAMVADVDTSDMNIDDYARKDISYILLSSDSDAESPYDDAALEELANELQARVDDGEEMSDIKTELEEEDGYTISYSTVTMGADTYDNEFGTAAWALATDETAVADVAETGWYVILCTNDDDTDAAQSAYDTEVDERKDTLFQEKYAALLEDSPKFTVNEDIWAKVEFASTPVYETETEEETTEEAQ